MGYSNRLVRMRRAGGWEAGVSVCVARDFTHSTQHELNLALLFPPPSPRPRLTWRSTWRPSSELALSWRFSTAARRPGVAEQRRTNTAPTQQARRGGRHRRRRPLSLLEQCRTLLSSPVIDATRVWAGGDDGGMIRGGRADSTDGSANQRSQISAWATTPSWPPPGPSQTP